ncbi:MAG: hypothetical protein M0R80_29525 [Proteobacteria bacterium]|jgi:hypothetical protein|nr:hypothetical protein [Pseudomonadota bacterium]
MTTAELITKLKIMVRDTTDTKWTSSEKTEAVTDAMYDPALATIVEDETLTVVADQQDYAIPSTIDVLGDVYLKDSDGIKARLSGDNWEQINTTLRFRLYPDTGTLVLVGYKHATTITDDRVNLVMYLSVKKLYEMLLNKLLSGFLVNDMTMAEVMTAIDYADRNIERERKRVQRANRGYQI